jgi:hypothetical protein
MGKLKKARAPRWWGRFVENLPKIYIPALYPSDWTVEKAEWWINFIPSKCPFERQIWMCGVLVLYVPPLCPLNPLSSQLYDIRLKAQTYLASLPNHQESV